MGKSEAEVDSVTTQSAFKRRKAAKDDEGDHATALQAPSATSSESWVSDNAVIAGANSLESGDFEKCHIPASLLKFAASQSSEPSVYIVFKAAGQLTPEEYNSCFSLLEHTSRKDYEASPSFGWRPRSKKREMLEEDMRYLLVRRVYGDGEVQGYLSFMLTFDSSPSVPVLYIYEIHLTESLRSLGLGQHLMHTAEHIAGSVSVQMVVLTCFLNNVKAFEFYRRRRYRKDASSPEDRMTRRKIVKADYVIMSKRVVPSEDGDVQLGALKEGREDSALAQLVEEG